MFENKVVWQGKPVVGQPATAPLFNGQIPLSLSPLAWLDPPR